MDLPSSKQLKKPLLLIVMISLLLLLVFLGLWMFLNSQLGESIDEETARAVYLQSNQLIRDIFDKDSRDTYEMYISSPVQEQDKNRYHWNHTVKEIRNVQLVRILPYEQQEEIYKAKSLSGDSPELIRYGTKLRLEVQVNGTTEKTDAEIEWIKEDGQLRLYLLKMPVSFVPIVGPVKTVYGIDNKL